MSKRKLLTTPAIERVAERLGVNPLTIVNWRYRGVPANWRSAIVTASRGAVALGDFPQLDKRRPQSRKVSSPPGRRAE
jgi:hypothetical protein